MPPTTTLRKYAKFAVALGGYIVTIGTVLLTADLSTGAGIGVCLLGLATALGVRQVPNR